MRKKLLLISIILLGTVLLSACGGGMRGTTWAGLAADETTAYLADGPFVHAVNLDNGREAWRFPGKSDTKLLFYAPPAVTSDGLVIVGSAGGNHALFALNPADITTNDGINSPVPAWTFTDAEGAWVATPLVVDNLVFAPNSDGNLYVLDLNDGRSAKTAMKTIELGGRLWAQPVTDGERIFVSSLDHYVFGINLETYEVWKEKVSGAIPGSPVIGSDGMLYVGSLASQLERFDPATGKHQTVFTTENWIWSTPSLDEDTLYFGDLEGYFYSFNTSNSSLNWSPIRPDGPITASAIVQNGHLLLATESGVIYAIDKDGKTLWFEAVGGKIYTTPVVVGDLILVAPMETDFYLAALNENGRRVWTFKPEN